MKNFFTTILFTVICVFSVTNVDAQKQSKELQSVSLATEQPISLATGQSLNFAAQQNFVSLPTKNLCGSEFTVNINCTTGDVYVDFVLSSSATVFTIFDGPTPIETPGAPFTFPLYAWNNTIDPFIGVPLTSPVFNIFNPVNNFNDGPFSIQIQAGECVGEIDLEQEFLNGCAEETNLCGSVFDVNIDCATGDVYVDFVLSSSATVFTIFDGPTSIVTPGAPFTFPLYAWNNTIDPFIGIPLTSPVFNIFNPVNNFNDGPFSIQIQAGECVGEIDLTQEFYEECGFKKDPTITELEESEIVAYPNPTLDNVKLDLPVVEDSYLVSVHDINGQLMSEFKTEGGTVLVEMSDFASGVYVVNVQNETVNHTERIQLIK